MRTNAALRTAVLGRGVGTSFSSWIPLRSPMLSRQMDASGWSTLLTLPGVALFVVLFGGNVQGRHKSIEHLMREQLLIASRRQISPETLDLLFRLTARVHHIIVLGAEVRFRFLQLIAGSLEIANVITVDAILLLAKPLRADLQCRQTRCTPD